MAALQKNRLRFLDGMRGLAALCIVFHHLSRHLYFGLPKVEWLSFVGIWEGFWHALISMSDFYVWVAVRLFFLLSGFCIHLKYAQSLSQSKELDFSFLKYFLKRLKKLYPILAAAIVITFACDFLSSRILADTHVTLPDSLETRSLLVGGHKNILSVLGTFVFMEPFFVEPYGSNYALWFIGHLGWFYMLYPVYLFISKRWGGAIAMIFSMFVGAVSILALRDVNFPLYPVFKNWWNWCFGAFLAEIYVGRYLRSFSKIFQKISLWVAGIIFLGASYLAAQLPRNVALTGDILWYPVLGFLIFVPLLSLKRSIAYYRRALNFFAGIGDMSFQLYASHIPVLVLISVFIHARYVNKMPQGSFPSTIGFLCAFFVAYLVFFITEKMTFKVTPR